jgi:alpha-L-rhamnosidase
MQSTYEILVATDAQNLRPGKADAWDSGRVKSSESLDVTYTGAPIHSQQRYIWKVLVWDDKGNQTTSAPAWFETGLMNASDWRAEWFTRNDPADKHELKAIRWIWLPDSDPMHVPSATHAQFRYLLHLDAKPQAASMHVLVRGEFTARVNGKVTGHHDEWGAFDREEIASLLHPGDNEVELDVISHRSSSPATAAPAAVAASIHLTRADGTQERIVTNGQWQARSKPDGSWQGVQIGGPLSAHFGIVQTGKRRSRDQTASQPTPRSCAKISSSIPASARRALALPPLVRIRRFSTENLSPPTHCSRQDGQTFTSACSTKPMM